MRLQGVIAIIAVAALGVATWRYTQIRAERAEGRRVLARSLIEGQHVALEGTQLIDVASQPAARAHVLQSADGKVKLDYLSGARAGLKVWDNGRRAWRWYPQKKVLAIS